GAPGAPGAPSGGTTAVAPTAVSPGAADGWFPTAGPPGPEVGTPAAGASTMVRSAIARRSAGEPVSGAGAAVPVPVLASLSAPPGAAGAVGGSWTAGGADGGRGRSAACCPPASPGSRGGADGGLGAVRGSGS